MNETCPHCGGSKAAAVEMCAACHELFHGSAKPAPAADAAPIPQQADQFPSPSGIPSLPASIATPTPVNNGKLIKALIGIGILAVIVTFVIVKMMAFADVIKYRTPEEKRAWYEQNVRDHEAAIQEFAAAQQAKGKFKYASVYVTTDAIVFSIEQLSDPYLNDISADAEKFRGTIIDMLGGYTPVYLETYYRSPEGGYFQVGSSIRSVSKSRLPGIRQGDSYPTTCYRIHPPAQCLPPD